MAQDVKDGDQDLVQGINQGLLLEELRRSGAMDRTSLSHALQIGQGSLKRLLDTLVTANLVRTSRSGRKHLFDVNPKGGAIIGVDFQDNWVAAMATDFCANVLWHHQVPATMDMVKSQRLHLAEALIDDAINDMRARKLRPLGIGVSVPGLVDRERGVLLYAPNLSWANVPISQPWEKRFKLPVFVENNANSGGTGEHFLGVAQNADNLIYLDAGMGIGGCIVIDGKIFNGGNGFAGEIGHMRVVPNGPRCGCGRRGCFEAVAGAEAVIGEVGARVAGGEETLLTETAKNPESPTIAELAHAAARGDALVQTVLAETATYLGNGIANLVNLLDPQLVVLGGTMAPLIPFMRDRIASVMRDGVLLKPCRAQLADSAYGDQAALVGAVAMVMRRVTTNPGPWLTPR